jgi:hypothetical protein
VTFKKKKRYQLPTTPQPLEIRGGGPAKVRILILYRLYGELWRQYKRRLWNTSQFLVPLGTDATLMPVMDIPEGFPFEKYDFTLIYEEARSDAPYSRLPRPVFVPGIRRPPHAKKGSKRRGLEFFSGVKAAVFGVYLEVLKEKL